MRDELYSIARREFAEDLIFEIGEKPVTLSIKGLLIARAEREGYNFSFFEVTETETVLAVQMKGFIVYIAIESDEELDDEEYAEVGKALLEHLTPKIALLVTKAEKDYSGKADILLDDGMSPELKEFFYSLLVKHRQGRSPYEQTEVA
ncbi:hypothetical protein [Thermococcus henrietii]|uniref:hypothetical protein n=1 Tax=Thermococcus henrietii TaxID=2016361 RepID=UPI000C077ABF|nr:hypothetical protein [Thermococcus henrietii]